MRFLVIATICISLTACGGGGGSGSSGAGAGDELFSGPYHMMVLGLGAAGITAVGTADADAWFRGSGIFNLDIGTRDQT